ncbi:MAG: hypothetical protein ACPGGK_01580 [Pikeienuella sp.]
MSALTEQFGVTPVDNKLRKEFLGWQCRVRLMMMRDGGGKPSDAITPTVTLKGQDEPMGHIIAILSKAPAYSVTHELEHMAAKTHDPAQWRESAMKYFSATFYQKAHEFSDVLTSTFPPGSKGAAAIRAADRCTLTFEAYGQRYDLDCKVWKLSRRNPLHRATMAHNRLFNPGLNPNVEVLGFEPDWQKSTKNGAF